MIPRKQQFNPNAAFVSLRHDKVIGGKAYKQGATVDVSNLSVRKKMQLFGANIIGYDYMLPGAEKVVEPAIKEEVKSEPVDEKVEVEAESKDEAPKKKTTRRSTKKTQAKDDNKED